MNTARRGNSKENATVRWLQDRGYLVGSRRHIGGAGDIIATQAGAVLLVEVKNTKTKWSHFGPADRELMLQTAKEHGANPYLAWWGPKAKEPELIHANHWPAHK